MNKRIMFIFKKKNPVQLCCKKSFFKDVKELLFEKKVSTLKNVEKGNIKEKLYYYVPSGWQQSEPS